MNHQLKNVKVYVSQIKPFLERKNVSMFSDSKTSVPDSMASAFRTAFSVSSQVFKISSMEKSISPIR